MAMDKSTPYRWARMQSVSRDEIRFCSCDFDLLADLLPDETKFPDDTKQIASPESNPCRRVLRGDNIVSLATKHRVCMYGAQKQVLYMQM
jgi:hypothetical protein